MEQRVIDAYAPAEMARRVQTVGVAKAAMPALQTFVLGVLAGAFIAFGGMLYTLVVCDADPVTGLVRWAGGIAFSLGLILVLVGGAELFTGNNLIVMAWADRQVTTAALLRNWGLVYAGNLVGALGSAAMYAMAGGPDILGGAVGRTAAGIAAAKVDLSFFEAFMRGILCNVLVCLAVWLCFAARTVSDKILAIIFPISAFVALGFEHSVANMYLIPIGYLAAGGPESTVTVAGFLGNLIPVTLGNIIGGSCLVALVYYLVYVRTGDREREFY